MPENEHEPTESDPWTLLPSERVCRDCNLAYHKHLPECPICRELAR